MARKALHDHPIKNATHAPKSTEPNKNRNWNWKSHAKKHYNRCKHYYRIACDAFYDIRNRVPNATTLLAISTIVLTLVTYCSLRDNQAATVLANRAWLKTYSPALVGKAPETAGDVIAVVMLYANIGKSVAINMTEFREPFWIDVKGHGLFIKPNDLHFPINDTCSRVTSDNGAGAIWPFLGGSETPNFLFPTQGTALRADQDFLDAQKMLGFHGCMEYESFQERHHSAYCFFLAPGIDANGITNKVAAWTWILCQGERQNFAD